MLRKFHSIVYVFIPLSLLLRQSSHHTVHMIKYVIEGSDDMM